MPNSSIDLRRDSAGKRLPGGGAAWTLRDATLFLAQSAAVSAVCLALELRMIGGLPFSHGPKGAAGPHIPMILPVGW